MLLLFKIAVSHLNLLRERESNPRPPGYEPDELPLLYPTICQKNIPLLHLFLISFSGKQSMSRSSGLCALLYTRRKGTVLNCMHTKQQSSCPSIYPVSRMKCFIYIPQRIKTSMQASCDESTQDERNLLLT